MPNCCNPTPTPCTVNNVCTEELSAYCIRYNQGDALSCIGVLPTDNRRLSDILKLMDTAICELTGSGDYSSYDVGCLSPVTTQQSWVEKISEYVCDLTSTVESNYTTLNNLITAATNENIGLSTRIAITGTCTEIAGLAYVNGTTTLNSHIQKLRDAVCANYNTYVAHTSLAAITWPSCITSSTTIGASIQKIVDLLCAQQAQIGVLSGAVSPCGKIDTYTFDTTNFTQVVSSTTSCRNQNAVALKPETLLKTSASDGCNGYLSDKVRGGDGILITTATVTESVCDYVGSVIISNTGTFDGIEIDAVTYTPGSPIVVTSYGAIQTYINTLNKGTAVVIYSSGILQISIHQTTGLVANTFDYTDGASSSASFVPVGCTSQTCEKVFVSLDESFVVEDWVTVGTSPAYTGTYTAYSSNSIKFRRKNGVTVTLKGRTNNSSPAGISASEPVFTLPVGYRPLEAQNFAVAGSGGAYIVTVSTAGVVSLRGDLETIADNSNVYMNFSFDID